jgi:hypothetical protein
MRTAFRNKHIFFSGDSTTRFIWGPFIKKLDPNKSAWTQKKWGQLDNIGLRGTENPGIFRMCDRLRPVSVYIKEMNTTITLIASWPDKNVGLISKPPCKPIDVTSFRDFTETLIKTIPVDVALLQSPNLGALCNYHSLRESLDGDAVIHSLLPLLLQNNAKVLKRRTATGWNMFSVKHAHCVSLQLVDILEDIVTRIGSSFTKIRNNDLSKVNDFFHNPLNLWTISHQLYTGTKSDGVHIMEEDNFIIVHLLSEYFSNILENY